MESDKREGKYIDPNAGKILFRVQAENWLKGYSADAATRQTLESRLRSQLYPYFGKRSLVSISPQVVRDWLGEMNEQGLGPTYQAVLFETLSSILNSAIDDRRIPGTPARSRASSVRSAPLGRWCRGRSRGLVHSSSRCLRAFRS